MRTLTIRFVALWATFFMGSSLAVSAETIISFSGQIDNVPSDLESQFSVDMPVTGHYSFDPSLGVAGTLMTVTEFQMTIGDYVVQQRLGLPRGDIAASPTEYIVVSLAEGAEVGDGFVPVLMALQLTANSPRFDPTSPMPPAFEQIDNPRWTLDFSSPDRHLRLAGTVDALVVPEPILSLHLWPALLAVLRLRRYPRRAGDG